MSDPLLPNSKSTALAGLMKLDTEAPTRWSGRELAAVLQHQLSAPLEYDLRTVAPGGEETISQMTAAVTTGTRPRSFGDLVRHPNPPLDLLGLMKDFARAGRDNGSLPPEVGTVLYYAAILLGMLRHNTRITTLDDRSMRKGLEWSMGQPWIDESLKALFAEGLKTL